MFSNHNVKPRETLYSIAMMYNMAPCILLKLNGLKRASDIRPGMQLKVVGTPLLGMDGVMLDNLDSMATFSDGMCEMGNEIIQEVETEMDSNIPQMSAGEYAIGEQIKFERYVVRPGDSVYKIAKKFNTTMANIIIANGLRAPYRIFPGQELTVPYTGDEIAIYIVKKGDTVYRIAMEYGVPISNIIDYNYLDKMATIYPNQQLIVKLK